METATIYVLTPNDRPDFRLVLTFLWNDSVNADTDGDSYNPASRDWTMLYAANRDDPDQFFHIRPAQSAPLILEVESRLESVAARVAYFLAYSTQGLVSEAISKEFADPELLRDKIGTDFSITEALERARNSRYTNTTLDNPYP